MPDHFQTLNVPRHAEWIEVRDAYRRSARRLHPDLTSGDAEKMREVTAAFGALKTPEKLEAYRRRVNHLEGELPHRGHRLNDADIADADGGLFFSRDFRATMRDELETAQLKRMRRGLFARLTGHSAAGYSALHCPYGLTHTGPSVRLHFAGSLRPGLNLFALPSLSIIPDSLTLAYRKTVWLVERSLEDSVCGTMLPVLGDEVDANAPNFALLFDNHPDPLARLRPKGW
jgi:curved DNA-binding protein CbpA